MTMESHTALLAEAKIPHGAEICPGWALKLFEILQGIADIAGMTAVSIGLVGAVLLWLRGEMQSLRGGSEKRWFYMRRARLFLGNYILFGLEMMIVSDLVHTFLQPDLTSLYNLGLVVVIRTAISFFLGKELDAVRHEDNESPTTTA